MVQQVFYNEISYTTTNHPPPQPLYIPCSPLVPHCPTLVGINIPHDRFAPCRRVETRCLSPCLPALLWGCPRTMWPALLAEWHWTIVGSAGTSFLAHCQVRRRDWQLPVWLAQSIRISSIAPRVASGTVDEEGKEGGGGHSMIERKAFTHTQCLGGQAWIQGCRLPCSETLACWVKHLNL